MKKNQPPQWLLDQEGLTSRQWKSLKRRQIRDLESAAKDFLNFASFAPNRDTKYLICSIVGNITSLKEACSIKNWGR